MIASLSWMPSRITVLLRDSSHAKRFLRASRGSGRTSCPAGLHDVIVRLGCRLLRVSRTLPHDSALIILALLTRQIAPISTEAIDLHEMEMRE